MPNDNSTSPEVIAEAAIPLDIEGNPTDNPDEAVYLRVIQVYSNDDVEVMEMIFDQSLNPVVPNDTKGIPEVQKSLEDIVKNAVVEALSNIDLEKAIPANIIGEAGRWITTHEGRKIFISEEKAIANAKNTSAIFNRFMKEDPEWHTTASDIIRTVGLDKLGTALKKSSLGSVYYTENNNLTENLMYAVSLIGEGGVQSEDYLIHKAAADLFKVPFVRRGNQKTYMYYPGMSLFGPEKTIAKADFEKLYETDKDLIQLVLKGIYDNTQNKLKAAGIDYVTLYRGMNWTKAKTPIAIKSLNGENGIVKLKSNPLTAFSSLEDVARGYGAQDESWDGLRKYSVHGYLTVTVPRQDIAGIPSTGMGQSSEAEVTLINRPRTGHFTFLKF